MLGSITPLGERGRRSHYGLTVTAFIAGSTGAGALLGGLLGGAGSLAGLEGTTTAAAAAAAVLLLALAFDLGVAGLRLPTVPRQVDDLWLYRYRGWVMGIGFGFQLGLGVVTIVTTAFTYATFLLAAMSGSIAGGVVIGATYGLVRAATVLGGARVDSPERLMAMHARLRRWEPPARRAVLGIQGLLLVVAVALAAGLA